MEIARHWRLKQQRLQFVGIKYPCGHIDLAGAPFCRRCVDEKVSETRLTELVAPLAVRLREKVNV